MIRQALIVMLTAALLLEAHQDPPPPDDGGRRAPSVRIVGKVNPKTRNDQAADESNITPALRNSADKVVRNRCIKAAIAMRDAFEAVERAKATESGPDSNARRKAARGYNTYVARCLASSAGLGGSPEALTAKALGLTAQTSPDASNAASRNSPGPSEGTGAGGGDVNGHFPGGDPDHQVHWDHQGDSGAPPRILESMRKVVGYDCAQPQAIRAVVPPAKDSCEVNDPVVEVHPRTYRILQEVTVNKVPATRCQGTMSRLGFYCGVYDHQTFVPKVGKFLVPSPLGERDCKLAGSQERVFRETSSGTADFEVKLNSTSYLAYQSVGVNGFPKGDDTHAQCQGGILFENGRSYERMNVANYEQISTDSMHLLRDQYGNLFDEKEGIRLPKGCNRERFCKAGGPFSYVWDHLTRFDKCFLYTARVVSGYEAVDAQGRRFFTSSDGSMVRLLIGQASSKCGQTVKSTNYYNVYLGPAEAADPILRRPIESEHISVVTMGAQRDDFTYSSLTDEIREQLGKMKLEACRAGQERLDHDYAGKVAEQAAIADGETTSLGEGQFATAAGEVYYEYACRPVAVTAKDSDKCYGSLPVDLKIPELKRWMATRGLPVNLENITSYQKDNPFFLEPHTHILTNVGIRMPCAKAFTPMYQNQMGQWIYAGVVGYSNNPAVMKRRTTARRTMAFKEFDFGDAGMYELKEVRELEHYRSVVRKSKGLAVELSEQYHPSILETHGAVPAHALFPELPEMDVTGYLFAWLYDIFREFGIMVAGAGGLIMIVWLLLTCLGFSSRWRVRMSGDGSEGMFKDGMKALVPAAAQDPFWKRDMKREVRALKQEVREAQGKESRELHLVLGQERFNIHQQCDELITQRLTELYGPGYKATMSSRSMEQLPDEPHIPSRMYPYLPRPLSVQETSAPGYMKFGEINEPTRMHSFRSSHVAFKPPAKVVGPGAEAVPEFPALGLPPLPMKLFTPTNVPNASLFDKKLTTSPTGEEKDDVGAITPSILLHVRKRLRMRGDTQAPGESSDDSAKG